MSTDYSTGSFVILGGAAVCLLGVICTHIFAPPTDTVGLLKKSGYTLKLAETCYTMIDTTRVCVCEYPTVQDAGTALVTDPRPPGSVFLVGHELVWIAGPSKLAVLEVLGLNTEGVEAADAAGEG